MAEDGDAKGDASMHWVYVGTRYLCVIDVLSRTRARARGESDAIYGRINNRRWRERPCVLGMTD